MLILYDEELDSMMVRVPVASNTALDGVLLWWDAEEGIARPAGELPVTPFVDGTTDWLATQARFAAVFLGIGRGAPTWDGNDPHYAVKTAGSVWTLATKTFEPEEHAKPFPPLFQLLAPATLPAEGARPPRLADSELVPTTYREAAIARFFGGQYAGPTKSRRCRFVIASAFWPGSSNVNARLGGLAPAHPA